MFGVHKGNDLLTNDCIVTKQIFDKIAYEKWVVTESDYPFF